MAMPSSFADRKAYCRRVRPMPLVVSSQCRKIVASAGLFACHHASGELAMKSTALKRLVIVPTIALGVLVGLSSCGKKDDSALLTYVPADSAYVFAAIEAPSKDLTDAWLKRVQPLWPIYETMLARLGKLTEIDEQSVTAPADSSTDAADATSSDAEQRSADNAAGIPPAAMALSKQGDAAMKAVIASGSRIAGELIKDLRGRDTSAKMSETGLAVPGLSAFYGIGMMPVARLQLSSADTFRAWIAKIETASASKFSTGKLGDQDYWYVGNDKLQFVMAIQGEEVVATLFPGKADDALRKRLLGMVKPEKSIVDSGELATLIKTEGYLPVGAGWIDFKRLFALYAADPAMVAAATSFEDKPLPALSAECRSDIESMIDKAPRMIFGYTKLSNSQMDSRGRWELAPAVATDLMALLADPVATGGKNADALFDMAFNIPVLKMKDFALKQAKSIAAQPYRCESLQPLNKAAVESVEKLSQVLPPPFSDITGVRITLNKVIMPPPGATVPDVRGKLLVASNNPSFLIGLAQMAVPQLASLAVKADGQPIEIPTKDMPIPAGMPIPALHVAMTDKALAFSFGEGESTTLSNYVKATPGAPGQWVTTSFSGDIYTLQGEFMQRMKELMPAGDDKSMDVADTTELYKFYASIFKRLEGNISVSAKGIELEQNVELKP